MWPILFFIITLIYLVTARLTSAAVLSFSPETQSITQGEILTTTILLDTNGESVDQVLAKIIYPTNLLTPQSLDPTGGFANIWYQNNIGSAQGELILDAGVSGSGVTGSQLVFTKINFTTLGTGVAQIRFGEDSIVYRETDDTNILTEARTANYTITGLTPTTTPPTSPSPTITGTTTPTSLTPSPSGLPNSGSVKPTLVVVSTAGALVLIGLVILRKA